MVEGVNSRVNDTATHLEGCAAVSYVAYGLCIRSAVPLPELKTGEGVPDVTVRLGNVDCPSSENGKEVSILESAEEMYLFRSEVGMFSIRGGREIIVDPASEVEERYLRLFILGPALDFLLLQGGLLVLHASTVSVNGRAVAFVGEQGQGKSTMTAAMHARGHDLVADDVTAIRVDAAAGNPFVLPGFPQIKLWPDAAASLGDDLETLPRLHSEIDKRVRCVAREECSSAPLPLRRIYVLDEGEIPSIEHLGSRQALMELTRHTYGIETLEKVGRAQPHFLQCANVVRNVAVCSLRGRRSLLELSDLARMVEKDVASSSGS